MSVTGAWSTATTYRREYYSHPKGAISNLKTVDTNWQWAGTAGWTSISTYTIKRFLEYPAGVFTPITWGGVATKAITSALTQAQMTSDAISVTIPAGTKFWIRTVWLGGTLPLLTMIGSAANIGTDDGSSVGDLGNSGTIPANATGGTATAGPPAIIGDIAVNNARSFLLLGDSECWGGITIDTTGDITGTGPLGGSGYMARACDPVGAYCKICYPGLQATEMVTNITATGGVNRITNFANALGYSEMWIEFGINDLGIALRTPAQLLADVASIAGVVRAGAVVSASTINAVSVSGNSAPWSHQADQNTYDASIRGRPAWLTGNIYDVADASMTSRDSGIWLATGGAWQVDGTHPQTRGAAGIVANLGTI